MLFFLLTIYIFKITCIFAFVVYCVVAVLMIVYNARTEELKKCVAIQERRMAIEFPIEGQESVDLEVLTEKLTEKEHTLQRSQNAIKNAEKVLSDLESKTSSYRDRYRSLMIELKHDIRKTEDEVRTLQSQISTLSVRREALRTEVLQQQEDYQRMLSNFSRELENKKCLFSTESEKSRHTRYWFSTKYTGINENNLSEDIW